MHLGYFDVLKMNSNTVLLSASRAELIAFRAALKDSFESGRVLAIHQLKDVHAHGAIEFFIGPAGAEHYDKRFTLQLGPEHYRDFDSKVQSLESCVKGHQYFDLPDELEFMISVGEYDESWWSNFSEPR